METDKATQLETCLTFYKQQMEHNHQTQQVEWKGTFGAWALLAAALGLSFQSQSSFRFNSWVASITTFFVFMLVAVHARWLWKIHLSEEIDKELWAEYRRMAHVFAELPTPLHNYKARTMRDKIEWISLEAGITFILALVLSLRIFALATCPN